MSAASLARRLREPGIVVAIGVHDGLTARLAERAGFEAVYHGGYAVAAHHHGLPDIGMVGLAEMTQSLHRVTSVSSVPVVCDADTGYGDLPGVRRTIQELERAGAAAVQLEDQVFPKRCGHLAGKEVIARQDMERKLRAAVAERSDPETVVIARTDALQAHGLNEAIDRGNAYIQAGADMVFVDAPRSHDDIAEIAQRVDGLSMANMTETGRTPTMTVNELEELGYALVIYPSTQTWIFARAYEELCRELLANGTTEGLRDRMMPFDEINAVLGLDYWERTS
jgi:2-methylisocitrate lyase-like PEP mutase family enzyme